MNLAEWTSKIQAAETALQDEAAEAVSLVRAQMGPQLDFCRRLITVFRVVLEEKQDAFPDTGWQVIVMSLVVKVLATVRAAYTLAAAGHGREVTIVTRSALESLMTAQFIAKEDSTVRAERWAQHSIIVRAQLLKRLPDLSSEPQHLALRDHILAEAPELEKKFPRRVFWASGLGKGNLRDLAVDVGMEWYYSAVYWSGSQATHGSAIALEEYLHDAPDRTPIYQFGLSTNYLVGELALSCDLLIRAINLLDQALSLGLGSLFAELAAEYKATFGADTAEGMGPSVSERS